MTALPPSLAERLLRFSLGREDRAAVLGDLQEEFTTIAASDRAAAARWYWRQTVTSLVPNLGRRLRLAIRRARVGELFRGWLLISAACLGMCGPIAVVIALLGDSDPLLGVVFIPVLFAITVVTVAVVRVMWPRRPDGRPYWLAARMPRFASRSSGWWNALFVLLMVTDLIGQGEQHWLMPVRLVWFAGFGALLFWPLWPVRKRAVDPVYSVRTPALATYRESNGNVYLLTEVGPARLAMSPPILGLAEPTLPPTDLVDGVVPMRPTIRRSWSRADTLRLFAAVNLAGGPAIGRLEIVDADGQVVRHQRVEITAATPQRPAPRYTSPDGPSAPVADDTSPPMGALDVTVPLVDLVPGRYTLRLTATDGSASTIQQDSIIVGERNTL